MVHLSSVTGRKFGALFPSTLSACLVSGFQKAQSKLMLSLIERKKKERELIHFGLKCAPLKLLLQKPDTTDRAM